MKKSIVEGETSSVLLRAFLLIAGLYALANHFHTMLRLVLLEPNFLDFAYYYVWGDLLNHGANLYQHGQLDPTTIAKLSKPVGFIIPHLQTRTYLSFLGEVNYSPAFIGVLSLFARMSFENAVLAWTIVNYTALVAAVLVLINIAGVKFHVLNLAFFSFIVFSFQPLIECIAIGQSNILILFFLSLSLYFGKADKHSLAGFFLSLAIQIKPPFGLIALIFTVKGMRKAFLSTVVFYVLTSLVTVPVVGINAHIAYFRNVLLIVGPGHEGVIAWIKNLSFLSAATRLIGLEYAPQIRVLVLIIAIALLSFVIAKFRLLHRKESLSAEFAVMTSLALLLPPFLEEHHLVVLYLPIFVIMVSLHSLNRGWQAAFIVGHLLVALRYSLSRFSAFSFGLPSILQNGKLYGLILISIAAFLCWENASIHSMNSENVLHRQRNMFTPWA